MVYSMGMCVFKQQIKSVGMQVKHKNNVHQYTFIKDELDCNHSLDCGCILHPQLNI